MTYFPDTIAAIVTAPMNAPVGIIRISGVKAVSVLREFFFKPSGGSFKSIASHRAYYGSFRARDGILLDRCVALSMLAPRSFTGEDVVELQCHGNLPLLKRILNEVLSVDGVRPAEPGEFSKRAFLNGVIDLAQAEAIQDIVMASSEEAAQVSLANLDGRLSYIIGSLRGRVIEALALVEASFEFAEEDIQTFDINDIRQICTDLDTELKSLIAAFHTSKLYDHGVRIAIVGAPNVGKSSLLNAILVEDRAIVSNIAGTTRDVIEGSRIIHGIKFNFKDTAGIRETADCIENLGIQRSQQEATLADCILCVVDDWFIDASVREVLESHTDKCILIRNKMDLCLDSGVQLTERIEAFRRTSGVSTVVCTSAFDARSTVEVESALCRFFGFKKKTQNSVHINVRQLRGLQMALDRCVLVQKLISVSDVEEEILAEELRCLAEHLGSVTGEIGSEHILDDIFSRFCIGK